MMGISSELEMPAVSLIPRARGFGFPTILGFDTIYAKDSHSARICPEFVYFFSQFIPWNLLPERSMAEGR
jgi:hypothetical protein